MQPVGYYDEKARHVKYRNTKTDGVWEGSSAEMRGAPSAHSASAKPSK
jgi:hypothetical protein